MNHRRTMMLSAALAVLSFTATGCSQSRQYVWGGSLGPVTGTTEIPLEILGETSGTATSTVYTLFGFIKWTSGDNLVGINGGGLYGFGFTIPFLGNLIGPQADDMAVEGAKYRAIEAVPRCCGLVDTHIKVDKEWFDILIFSRTTATATARGVAYGVKVGQVQAPVRVPMGNYAAPAPESQPQPEAAPTPTSAPAPAPARPAASAAPPPQPARPPAAGTQQPSQRPPSAPAAGAQQPQRPPR
ncbi:MAG: hypothetical protein NZ552_05560 [Planctomycetes bacterium]|nr:hypothetical protein [Planctomycetota bacterium]